MTNPKKALLLINIGTPDSTSVSDVRKYLTPFLNDPRVIDIPWLLRKILVNLIIVPFRAPKSAKLYKRLFTERGAPLLYHGRDVQAQLQKSLNGEYDVFLAMRYGNPALKDILKDIQIGGYEQITILPLFPHYASSSTGTVVEATLEIIKKWTVIPQLKVVPQFYIHPLFLEAFTEQINRYNPLNYDHVIFSYHGLPVSHINAVHPTKSCADCSCVSAMPADGTHCYKATVYETTRLLANKLQLKEGNFSVSFQSRLSRNWLEPFTDKVLVSMAKKGVKRVLIVAPAFVADCLETTVELGFEYKELFLKSGGEELCFVESLNSNPLWIKALEAIVQEA